MLSVTLAQYSVLTVVQASVGNVADAALDSAVIDARAQ